MKVERDTSRPNNSVKVDSWTEPVGRWHTTSDSILQHERLQRGGKLITRWPQLPFESAPTDCFQFGGDYWIWQPGVGGIRCLADRPEFDAHPSHEVAPEWFEQLVTRSWLPAIYPLWGRQAIHASAAFFVDTGNVVAFAGPSGSGKSTLAYGLGTRPGWRLLCDDTLAFSLLDGRVVLHPFKNESRLRLASATYFGKPAHRAIPIEWPRGPLTLKHFYLVVRENQPSHDVAIAAARASESYPLLLEQAYGLPLELPNHNQQLKRDYLTVATMVPASRLVYRRSFDVFDAGLESIDAHARATAIASGRFTPLAL